MIVSGSDDKTVRLWDARTGQPRAQPLRGHENSVNSVSLGVVDGDPVVVSGSDDKTVRLWDARTGQPRGQPLRGHEDGVNSVSLGVVDGRTLNVRATTGTVSSQTPGGRRFGNVGIVLPT